MERIKQTNATIIYDNLRDPGGALKDFLAQGVLQRVMESGGVPSKGTGRYSAIRALLARERSTKNTNQH